MTNISINILESTDIISQKILQTLLPQINTYLKKVFNKCKQQIEETLVISITSSPEYQSLLSGQLKYELGLPDPQVRLSGILKILTNIKATYTKASIVKNTIIGSFSLSAIKSDYTDILSLPDSTLTTEKGQKLEWLKWLLLFGDKTIIKDYTVVLGPNSRSRTGNAVMVQDTKSRWYVPPQFSGTLNNNWITRSIDAADDKINNILISALKE
jgi:hypothetical protein